MDRTVHPSRNGSRQTVNPMNAQHSPSQLRTMISPSPGQHQESQNNGQNNILYTLECEKLRKRVRELIYSILTKQERAFTWGPLKMHQMTMEFENVVYVESQSKADYFNPQKLKVRLARFIQQVILMDTTGSSSSTRSNHGPLNTSNRMTALPNGYGDSLLEAVRPFYCGRNGSGTSSTPTSNVFSVERHTQSMVRTLDGQSLRSISAQTPVMQNYQLSNQQTSNRSHTEPMEIFQQTQHQNPYSHVQRRYLFNPSEQPQRIRSDSGKNLQQEPLGSEILGVRETKEVPLKQDSNILTPSFPKEFEFAWPHSDRHFSSQSSSSSFTLNGSFGSTTTIEESQAKILRKTSGVSENLGEGKVKNCHCKSQPKHFLHGCVCNGCSGQQKLCNNAWSHLKDTSEDLNSQKKDSKLTKQSSGIRRPCTDAEMASLSTSASGDIQYPNKYLKVDRDSESSQFVAPRNDQSCLTQGLPIATQKPGRLGPITFKIGKVKKNDLSILPIQDQVSYSGVRDSHEGDSPKVNPSGNSVVIKEIVTKNNQEEVGDGAEMILNQDAIEIEPEVSTLGINQEVNTRSGEQIKRSLTLTPELIPEDINAYIVSLKLSVDQSKGKDETDEAAAEDVDENSCQLCCVTDIYYEAPPIYCASCTYLIKRNVYYHTITVGDARYSMCTFCFKSVKRPKFNDIFIQKSMMERKKNNQESEEPWVQCDKCGSWQHQVCALFNGNKNEAENDEYVCSKCYSKDIESGKRKASQHSHVLGAKDLERTILSDHIEKRLFIRLKQEREERAKAMGKDINEVPGAEDLVVRVVLSVDKKLQVNPKFRDAFQEEGYPAEFPYKSKVILLFQKIEGVEVCLFAMYAQEYGSRCRFPNQRWVYLSYLDSVKYFRPETRTVKGEALRTFVYHEILIGYLEYCKKRGFTNCFIWTCPPSKDDDYILYRHPQLQKTPKPEKLREWYLTMLKKATNERIVVDVSTLYEHYFVNHGEQKVTVTHLPYFDGDCWPAEAEKIINTSVQNEDGSTTLTKENITISRTLKTRGYKDISETTAMDNLLMGKLEKKIGPAKENFLVVQLQFSCIRCFQMILRGKRWFCKLCDKFQLCNECHEVEQKLEERKRHPVNCKEKHVLSFVNVNDVPLDTVDNDRNYECELFDSRHAFLSSCQENFYQYDTLRRAKHTSMMILYHLHTQAAQSPNAACDLDLQIKRAPETTLLESKDLREHAFQCLAARCSYPKCYQFKTRFIHLKVCKIHSRGGCVICKELCTLIKLHAQCCKNSNCMVPRCKGLKQQHKPDSGRKDLVIL